MHPDTLLSMGNLALLLDTQLGRGIEAEPLMRHVAAGLETTLGPTHPDTLNAERNLRQLRRDLEKKGLHQLP